jgi:L-lactate dehydrogenase complex protein LldG
MNSRDEILNRLKQVKKPIAATALPAISDKTIYYDYPGTKGELIATFKNKIESLAGEFYLLNSIEKAADKLLEILQDIDPALCRAHKNSLIERVKEINPAVHQYLQYIEAQAIDSVTFADYQVGITAADYLIARTGSILLRTISAGGRRLSVLPPIHIVLAETGQLVHSLDEALISLKNIKDFCSYATIISGPSRTSDIEKQLVLGAHGPKRLIVLLLTSQ